MSYQVLARKWRPRNFQEMVGQEHILRMLINALDSQRLHHAYLFTGTRGVGKTTLARILAKCLNCESGITSKPCGTCSICTSIDAGKFLDLIEVDAASRTKVEDTREILDNVQYAPTQGRYKIYLIDEVHMLSGHSFNALLKTLEEPPAHVKFLLATTDPKRLPVTILSRCLQFSLKRVPPEQIAQHLQTICSAEQIAYEAESLELLAQAADGSMRDALSILDQTIAFCGEKITTAQTRVMLGSIEQDAIFRLLTALAEHDGKKLLAEITALAEHAPNFNQVLEDLLSVFHQISLTQIIKETLNPAPAIADLAQRLSAEEVQLYYQIALIGRRDLPLAPNPQHGFEMILMRMLAFHPLLMNHPTPTPVVPQPIKSTPPVQTFASTKPAAAPQQPAPLATTPPMPQAVLGNQTWNEILPHLKLTGMAYALASNCTLKAITDNRIDLMLAPQHAPMLNPKMIERIEQTLNLHFNGTIKLEIKVTTDEIHTPALQKQAEQTQKKLAATQAIENDAHVQRIMGMFDGTIDLNSVKALD